MVLGTRALAAFCRMDFCGHVRSFKPVGVYRTSDPVSSLAVRVNLWRAGPSVLPVREPLPSGSAGDPPAAGRTRRRKRTGSAGRPGGDFSLWQREGSGEQRVESLVVRWQEKVMSWMEVLRYSAMAGPESSPADRSYYSLAQKLKERPELYAARKLFTYVDQDSRCDDFRRRSGSRDSASGYVPKSNIVAWTKSSRKNSSSVDEDNAGAVSDHVMLIMADLSPRHGASVAETEQDGLDLSVPLCCITWSASRGILKVFPDFSAVGEYYSLKSATGQAFNYSLSLVSNRKLAAEILSEHRLMSEVCAHHHRQVQELLREEFEAPANPEAFRLHFSGQVVTAVGFPGRWISVRFLVNVPEGWKTEDELKYGVTQSSAPVSSNGKSAAFFSHPFSGDLFYDATDPPCSLPSLFFQVMSTDWWGCQRTEGYGWATIPASPGRHEVVVKTWRISFPTFQAEMRRFFLAASTPLADVRPLVAPGTGKTSGRCMSRYGFQTFAAGQVVLELDVVTQESPLTQSLLAGRANVDDALYRSIDTVLEAFRKARTRMFEARMRLDRSLQD